MRRFAVCLSLLGLGPTAGAAQISLPQLTDATQTASIFKLLATNVAYRPVEGGAQLAKVFGLETGITVVATDTSSIASLIGTSTPLIPAANIDVALALPANFGLEAGFVPGLIYNGTTYLSVGGDIRWNISNYHKGFIFDTALRGILTYATLSSTQPLSGATIHVSYATATAGGLLTVGRTLAGAIEPYASLGFLNHWSSLAYSGTVSLFGGSFSTGTTSVTGQGLGLWVNVGAQVRIAIIAASIEYDNIFGLNSYAAKASFRF